MTTYEYPSYSLLNVDKVVQSVTNATKRLSQISTNTTSSKKRKSQNKIGPWKLGRTLGRGSTGRVRLAKNINTGKLAAVKIVPKSNFKLLENPKYKYPETTENKDRLPYGIEREIIIMKLISHQNIMALYDVWENKNDLYLILEYIEGGELFDYLIKRGKLQEFEAINYFKQIIDGISYLHQFNICHRDLKPENLLLDFNKNIKIADFGMAALEIREKLLETSCGSPHYASPEIVAGKNYHGAPSDIWSCGIILFALLTGHLPFDDENIRKLLLKVQNGSYVMPSDLSWEAKDLISKMLKVDPSERITIDLIMTHPLLTKYPSKKSVGSDFKNLSVRPIESASKIDSEILKNLSVLFHNCGEKEIIAKLLSSKNCPEKMFYYLLMKYRNEHVSGSTSTLNSAKDRGSKISQATSHLTSSVNLHSLRSIVQTTIYDEQTGQEFVTIEKAQREKSRLSPAKSRASPEKSRAEKSRSNTPEKRVLTNITNTMSREASVKNFKASTSFRKKTYMKRAASLRSILSRTTSVKSLKHISNSPLWERKKNGSRNASANVSLYAKDNNESIHQDLESDYHRDLQVVNDLESIKDVDHENNHHDTHKSKGDMIKLLKIHPNTKLAGKKGKSLLNFEMIMDEKFNEDHLLSTNSKSNDGHLPKINSPHDMKAHERQLAAKVHALNEAHEKRIKEEDARLLKEREAERKRQSILLLERQKEALAKLKKHKSLTDFADRRFVTEPVRSSLDPRRNSPLLRAKTLTGRDRDTAKVLSHMGIKNAAAPAPFASPFSSPRRLNTNLKTSSSKNLSSYIKIKPEKNDLTLDEYSEIEHSVDQSFGYKIVDESRLDEIIGEDHEDRQAYDTSLGGDTDTLADKTFQDRTFDSFDKSRVTINVNDNLPNPRFSRFSFGGLMNQNTEGDLLIMNSLTSTGTVIRKPKSQMKKSGTTNLLVVDGLTGDISRKNSRTVSRKPSEGTRLGNRVPDNDITQKRKHLEKLEKSSRSRSSNQVEDNRDGRIDDLSSIDARSERLSHTPSRRSNRTSEIFSERHVSQQFAMEFVDVIADSDETAMDTEFDKSRLVLDFNGHRNVLEYDNGHHDQNYDKSRHVLDDYDKSRHTFLEEDYSNFDIISTRVADVGVQNVVQPSIVEHLSKESLGLHEAVEMQTEAPRKERLSLKDIPPTKLLLLPERQNTLQGKPFVNLEAKKQADTAEKKSSGSPNFVVADDGFEDVIEDEIESKQGLLRKTSLNPKRVAPKPPLENVAPPKPSTNTNRFLRTSAVSKAPSEATTSNWFKKFFQSISKPKEEDFSVDNKNLKVIDSTISSVDLIRVIRTHLQLKQFEGSITNVDFDEEFGLINGVIPSKFAHGKKLKFRIEIIDLINSSSLQLMKIKGNEKGFKGFVDIVSFVIKQEEEVLKGRGFQFLGFKK